MSEIAAWLKNLGLSKYIETFAENDIDVLWLCSAEDDGLYVFPLSLSPVR